MTLLNLEKDHGEQIKLGAMAMSKQWHYRGIFPSKKRQNLVPGGKE